MPESLLESYGWTPFLAQCFAPLEAQGLLPGRICSQASNQLFRVVTAAGEVPTSRAGVVRDLDGEPSGPPAVGDWVGVEPVPGQDEVRLRRLLPRTSAFVRQAAGLASREQVVAANVDTLFLLMGADTDYNLRRLERYLTLAWESGAAPVVLLNKLDLLPAAAPLLAEVARCAPGVPIHGVSAVTGEGLELLEPYLLPGSTVALLGSSGVGKSTLVNRLLGSARQATAGLRPGDGRGRHTTTSRELVRLPGGAILLDTPGMRELQLLGEGEGLDQTFAEIVALAAGCRFPDCRHEDEPGCAVLEAVAAGEVPAERLAAYQKLQRELVGNELRHSAARREEEKRMGRRMGKMIKEIKQFNPKWH